MPYFVYYTAQEEQKSVKSLEFVEECDGFKAARNIAREKRSELNADSKFDDCRLIFAKNKVAAEKLLMAPREERVIGED